MTEPPIVFSDINGIRTAEAIIGQGRLVLALHGWGADISLMWPLAETLAPLGYRIYVPDLPGFGQSELPPAAWSVHDYAAFLLAYLDHHNLEQVYLIGHSFGGSLGLIMGADYSERLVKTALVDSAGVRPALPFWLSLRQRSYKLAQTGLRALRMAALAHRLRDWYSERYSSEDYKNAGPLRETFVKVVNEDLLPYAARVKVPTLLFWGERDEDTPLWQGKLLEQTIPDAGLIVFPGSGHYSYLENLAEFVRIVDYFFKQQEQPATRAQPSVTAEQ